MHSVVATYTVTDKLTYIDQTDFLTTEQRGWCRSSRNFRLSTSTCCTSTTIAWGVGARFEWYNNEGVFTDFGQTANIYALTIGCQLQAAMPT